MKTDQRFTKSVGVEVFTGNELLVKGCLETEGGTHLWTGYPGSPVSGFFDTASELRDLLMAHGIRATMANNEALAAAMVNGSQMLGLRAVSVQKSVGLHVAADALALGNLAGAHPEGGAVIIVGDDPWSDSTQVPADSRYLCKHLMMPVVEPSDPQELKDWIDLGFKLSRESRLYIGYLVTTNQADGGGSVNVRPNHYPAVNTKARVTLDTSDIDFEHRVLLPPRTWRQEQEMPERFARLWAAANRLGVNRVEPAADDQRGISELGFVTSAQAYCYLRHALAEMGLDGVFPILKLGVTYPLDAALILRFVSGLSDLFVIEERRGFLEEQIVEIITRARQENNGRSDEIQCRVWGKQFPFGLDGIPSTRGLNPSKLIGRLGRMFLQHSALEGRVDRGAIERELALVREVKSISAVVAPRTPTFCPGCPHRDSASVLLEIKKQFRDKQYMEKNHGMGPVDLVCHGDTGCYTMLMFEPTKDLMHNYSGMGLGGGTGAGIDPFIKNKQIVFMGDSTFFHSGQIAISNSIKNGQDITYIILDNHTTAMTGHQPTPGLEEGLMGEKTLAQSIDAIVAGMVQQAGSSATVVRVNPADREHYRRILEQSILKDGVKVVVADKECGITFHRRAAMEERRILRDRGFLPRKRFINITPEVCENCLECTRATGCPGLTLVETPYGQKLQTDMSWCVSDGACVRFTVALDGTGPRVKACPSFEEVEIQRSQKPPEPFDYLDRARLDEPPFRRLTGTWNGYLAGVGGMGIGTATAVLVLAGHKEGYSVRFCDKKGLAIRNGGVYSMVIFSSEDARRTSNLIPYGKADLLLGVDILEAARAIDPATNQRIGSRHRTSAIINTHKTPTILTLLGKDDFDVAKLEEVLRENTRKDQYYSVDVSEISERFFGTKLFANIIMLGIAFQRGLLPLSMESLEWAIRAGMGASGPANLRAFTLGRHMARDIKSVETAAGIYREPDSYESVLDDAVGLLSRSRSHGADLASAYRQMVERASEQLQVTNDLLAHFARRTYDLVQFDGIEYARQYVDWVRKVHEWDSQRHGYAATKAVIWNLHKVMLIKDELYVAHLLTSEEKHRRDRIRFNVDPARGDRIIYRHFNRPQFTLLGRDVAWDMKTRDWMLNLFKRMRWLRRLLPDWHRREREFRDWYLSLLPGFKDASHNDDAYRAYVRLMELPSMVSGYREIRYMKMKAVRARADEILSHLKSGSSSALLVRTANWVANNPTSTYVQPT